MEEAFMRFPHLPEQIMEELDFESLTKSRLVAISWKQFIDEREYRWFPFKDDIADLKNKCRFGETPFYFACENGKEDLAKTLLKNSVKLHIDLNAKKVGDTTAFHKACINNHAKIAELIMKNYVEFNIELNTKDKYGYTAFHWACCYGSTRTVQIMINNSESFKLDLTVRNNGETGFQIAQDCGESEVVNLIKSKMPKIAF